MERMFNYLCRLLAPTDTEYPTPKVYRHPDLATGNVLPNAVLVRLAGGEEIAIVDAHNVGGRLLERIRLLPPKEGVELRKFLLTLDSWSNHD